MSTTTKNVDADVSEFYYRSDLTIDPPLPDSKAKAGTTDHLKLRQFKDEDVTIIDGEIVVVTKNVTIVEAVHNPDSYTYEYKALKDGVKGIAKLAKDAGSKLNGMVLIRDANRHAFFRIAVTDNIVKVEAASLGWPDGTSTPFPDPNSA